MKKSVFLLLLLSLCFTIFTPKIYATEDNQKVYIDVVVKNILDFYDEDYYMESSNKFYYYVNPYIKNDITSSSQLIDGDMDSFVYVVKTLEYHAKLYDSNANTAKVNNLVLGYLRSIVTGYDGLLFQFTMGNIDDNFVNYINNNSSLLWLRTYLNNNLEIDDPLNPTYSSLNKIDIIHMMATIDGTYAATEPIFVFEWSLIMNGFQRDLSGWAGDLQYFVRYDLYKQNLSQSNLLLYAMPITSNNPIDFGDYLNLSSSGFGNADMLADIDAMTIAKYFLDVGNTLSVALNGYYNFVHEDNTPKYNRYRVFVLSATEETMYRYESVVSDFKNEVYYSMGILDDEWYGLQDWPFASWWIVPEFFILNGVGYSGIYEDDFPSFPDWMYRLYGAKQFMNYILDMASPPQSTPPGGGGGGRPPIMELPNFVDPFGAVVLTYQDLNDWYNNIVIERIL